MLKYFLLLWLLFSSASFANTEQQLAQVLTQFHQAATNADFDQYFSLLTDDAVFMGTDASERWSKAEFQRYVAPLFEQGKGWQYQTKQRNLHQINDTTYVFDELLINDKYGECRSSGVLVKRDDQWKIAQYNLSVPLPNAIAKQLIQQIQQHKQQLVQQ